MINDSDIHIYTSVENIPQNDSESPDLRIVASPDFTI